jgi:putative peptidoglycan lipid II flippase
MAARRSVVSSAKLIAVCTLVSRITGLARDILLAQAFGLGWVQDAFSYAFQFPNLFRRLFGEGAMSPVFVPTFTKTLETEGHEAAWRLLARTLALMTVALVVLIVAVALIIAGIWFFLPVDPEKAASRELLLGLTAAMLPFMLTICVVALLSSILNCVGSFVPAALASVVLNIGMIVGIAWLAPAIYPQHPHRQVYIVALSVVVSGVFQIVFLLPALRKNRVVLGWQCEWREPTVKRMLQLLPPVALGQGVLAFGVFLDSQICAMLSHVQDTPATTSLLGLQFAYPLQEGALSAITYAQRLYQFPLGVLVVSLATAALPAFSRLATHQEWPEWTGEVRQSLRLAVFEGVLAGVVMILVPEALTRLLFERGRFTPEDTARTAYVVACYGFGLWAFCAQHIVLRAFYSLGEVRTPLMISVVLLPVNAALSLTLVWFPAIREAAFAISSSLTASASVIVGLVILQRRVGERVFDRTTLLALLRMAVVGGVTAIVLALSGPHWARLTSHVPGRFIARLCETGGLLVIGTAAFLAAAWALRLHEVSLLVPRRFLRRRTAAG